VLLLGEKSLTFSSRRSPGPAASDLSGLRARFRLSHGDITALEVLNAELRRLSSDAAIDLQCEVMAELKALRSGARPIMAPERPRTLPSHAVLRAVMDDVQDRGPNGRPLHRYAVSDRNYRALRETLDELHQQSRLEHPSPESAAVFCLYVSEWFRRDYQGGPYSWEMPAPSLIGALSDQARILLARDGLRWWGRAPRQLYGGEQRLLSLVLEGGFPTRLLELRENGKIAVHLRLLTARLEAIVEIDEEQAAVLSSSLGGGLGSYHNNDFHALCADLIVAVVRLKREAQGRVPAGISVSSFLDGTNPSWRDALPISLSGDGATRLIDELVSAKAQQISRSDARCRRLLIFEGGDWTGAVRIGVEGLVALSGARVNGLGGRLRLHPAGSLASLLAGEIGLAEAPTDGADHWLCRGRGRPPTVRGFALEDRVEIELRAGEHLAARLTWPGGEPLRSEVLSFVDERGDEGNPPPTELVYLTSGSMQTRRSRVYLLTPSGFSAQSIATGASIAPIWRGKRWLFELITPAYVWRTGDDRYRIDVGVDAESSSGLVIEGESLRGLEAEDPNVLLYKGAPRVRTRTGSKTTPSPPGQVIWRYAGQTVVKDWTAQAPKSGLVELTWRDPKSRTVLDRAVFAILPQDSQISARPIGLQACRYDLTGFGGWSLRPAVDEGVAEASTSDGMVLTFAGRPRRRVAMTLTPDHGQPLTVTCPVATSGGGFFRSDGEMLPDGIRVVLDDLSGATAFTNGRTRLFLSGPHGQTSTAWVDEQRPLWSLSDEILRLLNASSDLDDTVRLELSDAGSRRLNVGRYATTLRIKDHTASLDAQPGALDQSQICTLEWVSIFDMTSLVLAEASVADMLRAPIDLPENIAGPGLLLLRRGDGVVGRPSLYVGRSSRSIEGSCTLQKATGESVPHRRAQLIGEAIEQLGDRATATQDNRNHLLSVVRSLRGIPASAFDVLTQLCRSPSGLSVLAAAADEADREGLWRLEKELPFMWCLIPVSDWVAGFATKQEFLTALLEANDVPAPAAAAMVEPAIRLAAQSWVDLDPLLRAPLFLAGLVESEPSPAGALLEAAQDRIRRTADLSPSYRNRATPTPPSSCFREQGSELSARLPSFERFDASQWEGLDAACAAALAAAGLVRLSDRHILRIRAARAEEPFSFAESYAACLLMLAKNQPLSC
jgi:hypothetical protein